MGKFGVEHYSNYILSDEVKTLKDVYPNQLDDWSKRSFIFVDYNKIDAELAPPPKSVGAICGVDHLKNWEGLNKEDYKAKKEEVAQILLSRLEKQFVILRPQNNNDITFQIDCLATLHEESSG